MRKRKIAKPRPFRRRQHGVLVNVCKEITYGDHTLAPHLYGNIEYLPYEEWPAFAVWMNRASLWLAAESSGEASDAK